MRVYGICLRSGYWGIERWLSDEAHLLTFQRTQLPYVSIWWLTTTCHSGFRGTNALLGPLCLPGKQVVHIYTCRQIIHTHKINPKGFFSKKEKNTAARELDVKFKKSSRRCVIFKGLSNMTIVFWIQNEKIKLGKIYPVGSCVLLCIH